MGTMIRGRVLAVLLAGAAASAQAPAGHAWDGEKVMLAYCIAGQGCTGQLSEVAMDDLQLLLPGTEAMRNAPNPVLVFPRNKAGEWTYYVDTRRQLGELHREFGGQGQPVIALFPPTLPGAIEPRDGHWQVTADAQPQVRNCLPGVAAALRGRTAMVRSGPMAFKRPFHGRQLIDNPSMRWIMTAPNRYTAALQAAGAQAMGFRYEIRVLGEDRMEGQARVQVDIPGQKTCSITTPFRYQRTAG